MSVPATVVTGATICNVNTERRFLIAADRRDRSFYRRVHREVNG